MVLSNFKNFIHIDFVAKEQEPMLMWDADAILLKKFDFFNQGKTIKYGTTFEFHRAYFETNKKIFKELPKYFIAMTNNLLVLHHRKRIFDKKTKN